jgi:hypothetical protein
MKKALFALVVMASMVSQAALLTYEAGPQQLSGVVLNKTASINDASGKPTALKLDLLGAGLRSKTVLVVEAKVYVAQLFSDNKAGFSRDGGALTSLAQNSNRVALKIDMLRTVDANTLAASFKEALAANGYAIDAELNNLITAVQSAAEATSGKAVTLLLVKDTKNNQTDLYYEDTKGAVKSFVGSQQLMTKVLSIWLGTPVDKGLEKMKNQLLQPVY